MSQSDGKSQKGEAIVVTYCFKSPTLICKYLQWRDAESNAVPIVYTPRPYKLLQLLMVQRQK